MFYFSTVYEYLDYLDAPECTQLKLVTEPLLGRLKDVQRPLAYQVIRQYCPKGANILEAGAGVPLILEALRTSHGCKCTVADKYLGKGRGPNNGPQIAQAHPNIRFVNSYVGEFDPSFPTASYDAVFSVSVLEHMNDTELAAFNEDCVRLVKPGGIIFHAVDISIDGPEDQDARFNLMARFLLDTRITPLVPDRIDTLVQARKDATVFTLAPTVWRRWKQINPPEFDFSVYRRITSLNIGMRKV